MGDQAGRSRRGGDRSMEEPKHINERGSNINPSKVAVLAAKAYCRSDISSKAKTQRKGSEKKKGESSSSSSKSSSEYDSDLDDKKKRRKKKDKSKKKKSKKSASPSSSSGSESDSGSSIKEDSSGTNADSKSDPGSDRSHQKKKRHKKKKKEKTKEKFSTKKSKEKEKTSKEENVATSKVAKLIKGYDNKMEELAKQMKALSVHVTSTKPEQKKVSTTRAHVWCVTCGQHGLAPQECPIKRPQVRFITEEEATSLVYGVTNDSILAYYHEEAPDTVYQVAVGGACKINGQIPGILQKPMAPMVISKARVARVPSDIQAVQVICYNCRKLGHYSNNCPKPRRQGNGRPPQLCHDRQEEQEECKKKKREGRQEANEQEEKEEVAPSQDNDYQRDNPKWFYPKVEADVKRHLEELEAKEAQTAIMKDLVIVATLRKQELEQLKPTMEVEALVPIAAKETKKVDIIVSTGGAKRGGYNITQDLLNCPVTATMGQLLKDNTQYRKEVKGMLTNKRKRLPKVGSRADVMTIYEDLGAPEISSQISGCILSYVPVDGGSGVNLMIEAIAFELGYEKFEPTTRTLRMADGAKVVHVGILTQVLSIIGGQEFYLNYLVMQPGPANAIRMQLISRSKVKAIADQLQLALALALHLFNQQ
ncbi:unnamed protein product [Calypogeia fissa]